MIRFEQVSFTYPSGYEALKELSCDIAAGERVKLIGKTGSGKTTFIMLILGMMSVTKGRITVLDQAINRMNQSQLARLRRKIGLAARWLPLISHLSALENIIQPLLILGISRSTAEKKGRQILSDLELGHRYRDMVSTFSDTEYSKLLIARALIHEPSLLVIDDALDCLDSDSTKLIDTLIHDRHQQGLTVVECGKYFTPSSSHPHTRTIELMDSHLTDDTEHLLFDIAP
ncbi:MAG: ATP-binding cassette domain-containing protein [Betaproteobacteria bacterium]|nr:ATP-binding cassette domain-containing protein [Betaproteobacteria bacterium]